MIGTWVRSCERAFGLRPGSHAVGKKVREHFGDGLCDRGAAGEPSVGENVVTVRNLALGLWERIWVEAGEPYTVEEGRDVGLFACQSLGQVPGAILSEKVDGASSHGGLSYWLRDCSNIESMYPASLVWEGR